MFPHCHIIVEKNPNKLKDASTMVGYKISGMQFVELHRHYVSADTESYRHEMIEYFNELINHYVQEKKAASLKNLRATLDFVVEQNTRNTTWENIAKLFPFKTGYQMYSTVGFDVPSLNWKSEKDKAASYYVFVGVVPALINLTINLNIGHPLSVYGNSHRQSWTVNATSIFDTSRGVTSKLAFVGSTQDQLEPQLLLWLKENKAITANHIGINEYLELITLIDEELLELERKLK